MPVEVVGVLAFKDPEDKASSDFDLSFMTQLLQALDQNGYDRVLVPQSTYWPDSMPIATWATGVTCRLAMMVAHRPGFVVPTMAARMFAALDHVSNGRAGIHIITGGNDKEMACDGDFTTKDVRYRRSAEFAQVVRKVWSSDAPFDHDGEFFKFRNAQSQLRPVRPTGIPIYWGGSSEDALRFAGACADIYSLPTTRLAETASVIEKVRGYARQHGRGIAFQAGTRVIVGDTEAQAWEEAHRIADKLRAEHEGRPATNFGGRKDNALSTRSPEKAKSDAQPQEPTVLDTNLWTGTSCATQGRIPPVLVGTVQQVIDSIARYYELGVTSFFVRGFGNPVADAALQGQRLIPLLRERVADMDRRMAMHGLAQTA